MRFVKVYKNHYCKHCGKRIPIRESHKRNGIPEHIHGHQCVVNSPLKKGHKIGKRFRKGEKAINWNGFKNGEDNLNYVDGCGFERNSAIYNSLSRGLPYPSFLNKPFKGASPHHLTEDVVAFIPLELHRSVGYHSVKKNINMIEINELALEFVSIEAYKKYGKR